MHSEGVYLFASVLTYNPARISLSRASVFACTESGFVHTSSSPGAHNSSPPDNNSHSGIDSALRRSASSGHDIPDKLCFWALGGSPRDSSGHLVGLEAGGAGGGVLPWS